MSVLTGITSNFKINAKENWQNTLNGTISASTDVLTVIDNSAYDVGDWVFWTIDAVDPSSGVITEAKKEVVYGQVATSNQLTGVVRGIEGTAQIHTNGAIVMDYYTAAHHNLMQKMFAVAHDTDGTLKDGSVNSVALFTDNLITKVKLAPDAKPGVRPYTIASTATLAPNLDNYTSYEVSAQAAPLAISAPTGTFSDKAIILFFFKDNGTARAITWDAAFVNISGLDSLTTTVINKWSVVGCVYSAAAAKWQIVSITTEA